LTNAEDNGWSVFFHFEDSTDYNQGARRLVTHYRIYEEYEKDPMPENDFGIIYINTPIIFNDSVSKAELALINSRELSASIWSDCQLAGKCCIVSVPYT
jgi:hypothetical protein